jgi:hypothetical protein
MMPADEPAPLSYKDQLVNELQSIAEWSSLSYWDKVDAADFFMSNIGILFIGYFQYHLDEAKQCGLEHKTILKHSIPAINEFYIIHLEHRIRNADYEFDDPWERACWLRTNVAAFEEMFGQITGPLNAGFIKDYIENARGYADPPSFLL